MGTVQGRSTQSLGGLKMDAAKFDPSALIGAELRSVLIGSHQAELNFDSGSAHETRRFRIDIEAGFEIEPHGGRLEAFDNESIRRGAAALVSLIDQSIQAARFEIDGALNLQFESGATLKLCVSAAGFDSYHLHSPEGSMTV
jgi:uncharacterized protein DUF6188